VRDGVLIDVCRGGAQQVLYRRGPHHHACEAGPARAGRIENHDALIPRTRSESCCFGERRVEGSAQELPYLSFGAPTTQDTRAGIRLRARDLRKKRQTNARS